MLRVNIREIDLDIYKNIDLHVQGIQEVVFDFLAIIYFYVKFHVWDSNSYVNSLGTGKKCPARCCLQPARAQTHTYTRTCVHSEREGEREERQKETTHTR